MNVCQDFMHKFNMMVVNTILETWEVVVGHLLELQKRQGYFMYKYFIYLRVSL